MTYTSNFAFACLSNEPAASSTSSRLPLHKRSKALSFLTGSHVDIHIHIYIYCYNAIYIYTKLSWAFPGIPTHRSSAKYDVDQVVLTRPWKKMSSWAPCWCGMVCKSLWNKTALCRENRWVFPKIRGVSPQIIPFVHRVWNHYFHHPFWWFSVFFGSTPRRVAWWKSHHRLITVNHHLSSPEPSGRTRQWGGSTREGQSCHVIRGNVWYMYVQHNISSKFRWTSGIIW